MSERVNDLIEQLAGEARSVRRLRPPMARATIWLLGVAALSAVAILSFADLTLFATRVADRKLLLEVIGTLLTGLAAVIAAFHLSLPDRSARWALVPLPPLVLWIASSGYSCYRHWLTFGPDGWSLGESAECFRLILGVSIPVSAGLFLALRRARPLAPIPVAVVGGLGVAAIAAFLLQFFHPFDVTFMDLGVHLATVGLVILGSVASSRFLQQPGFPAPRG